MGKQDRYARQVGAMLEADVTWDEIESFLLENCNLPGRRGNLELAWAFGDAFELPGVGHSRWRDPESWLDISEGDAPTGERREYLPFCALQAAGGYYQQADERVQRGIIAALKAASGDGRWRIREGVAMGFQRIAEVDFETVLSTMEAWVEDATWMERRAIVATLAHPELLVDGERVGRCLALVDRILVDLLSVGRTARRGEGYRVLKKGLQYAISVLAAAWPSTGFDFISRWAMVDDREIQSILRANLKKARLAKAHPERVAEALQLLDVPGA
jgi:hypothetical protein